MKKRAPLRQSGNQSSSSQTTDSLKRRRLNGLDTNSLQQNGFDNRRDEIKEIEEKEDDESETDEEINLSNNKEQTIEQFTFEFNDMKEPYFHGIRTILSQWIVDSNESSKLSDLIVNQATVGTVVNNEGDDDVFGFATILPIQSLQSSVLISQISRIAQQHKNQNVRNIFQQSQHGFLIHGRFSNFPSQLIYELHRNLWEDVHWAKAVSEKSKEQSDDLEHEVIETFKVMHRICLLAPCSLNETSAKLSISQLSNMLGSNEAIFLNFEDDLYFQFAEEAYYLNLPNDQFKHGHHILVVLNISDLVKVLNSLKSMLL